MIRTHYRLCKLVRVSFGVYSNVYVRRAALPTDDWIPFSLVLKRILEPQGYVLKRIVGDFRYFDPPAGSSLPRLGFPVRNTRVSKDYVEKILEIIREDEERRGSD